MTDIYSWSISNTHSAEPLTEEEIVLLKSVYKILLLDHHYLEIYYSLENL